MSIALNAGSCRICDPTVLITGECDVNGCRTLRIVEGITFGALVVFVVISWLDLIRREKKMVNIPSLIFLFCVIGSLSNYFLLY
jgi:hypothetical protein